MPLIGAYNVTHSSPGNKRNGMPCRATGDFGQKTEAGARDRFRPQTLLGFP